MATKDQIKIFLADFKEKIKEKELIFVPRPKNLAFLRSYGLFVYELESIIMGLTEIEYIDGPKDDDDGSEGQIWEFCTNVEGCSTYVKLKLDSQGAKCISFHGLEYSVEFPFK
ncbi:MAG: hypothetical protein NTY09_07725 [bacterium]|nr:hypothetical protein [bacterium]